MAAAYNFENHAEIFITFYRHTSKRILEDSILFEFVEKDRIIGCASYFVTISGKFQKHHNGPKLTEKELFKDLYITIERLRFQYNTVFSVNFKLPKDPWLEKNFPKNPYYLFSKNEKKLIPIDIVHGPRFEEEKVELRDDCNSIHYNEILLKHYFCHIAEQSSDEFPNACCFSFFDALNNRSNLLIYRKIRSKILRNGNMDEDVSSVDMILEQLYDFCRQNAYDYDSIFLFKNNLIEKTKWEKISPKPGLYIFLKNETKLIPYEPTSLVHYSHELHDDCEKYTGIFYDIPNMNNNRFGMHIQDNRMDPVAFDFLYSDFLSIAGSIHTPKKFVDHFFLCCFKNQIPDGTEFTFFDKLDEFSACRKLLPKKVKLDLKNGKIDVLEMFS